MRAGVLGMTRIIFTGLFNEIKVKQKFGPSWKTLSMGMTNDFEIAIEEGSTLVRIGTGLFAA